MDQTAQIALGAAAGGASSLNIWELFLAADPIVKGVMAMLLIASVICWAIIFDKSLKVRSMRRRASDFEEAFWSGGSLEDLYDRMGNHPEDPMSAVFASAMREWRRSAARGLTAKGNELRASLRHRIDQVMSLTISREMEALEKRMTFLASVG